MNPELRDRVLRSYQQQVAKTCHSLYRATEPADIFNQLNNVMEAIIKTVASTLHAFYRSGDRNRDVDVLLEDFLRPSVATYQALTIEVIRATVQSTHQDLREGHNVTVIEPGGKRGRKKLTGADYEKWVQNEVVGCKDLLEQRLGIKVNCFAVPFGNYNEHVKELARNAGYEAMFTVYGQPITFTSPMDAIEIGRAHV